MCGINLIFFGTCEEIDAINPSFGKKSSKILGLDSPTPPPGVGARLVDCGMPRGAERYRPFAVAREWHLFLFLGVIAKLLKYGTYKI